MDLVLTPAEVGKFQEALVGAFNRGELEQLVYFRLAIDLNDVVADGPHRQVVFDGRSSLLQGLPPAPLVRSAAVARLDLNNIVSGLQQMGRLTDPGGARPVIVVVDNALAYLPPQGEVAQALNEAKRELVQFYGGEYTERKSVECIHTEAGICQPSGTNSKFVVSREASSSRY